MQLTVDFRQLGISEHTWDRVTHLDTNIFKMNKIILVSVRDFLTSMVCRRRVFTRCVVFRLDEVSN